MNAEIKNKCVIVLTDEYNKKLRGHIETLGYWLRSRYHHKLSDGLIDQGVLTGDSSGLEDLDHKQAIGLFLEKYKELTTHYQNLLDELQ